MALLLSFTTGRTIPILESSGGVAAAFCLFRGGGGFIRSELLSTLERVLRGGIFARSEIAEIDFVANLMAPRALRCAPVRSPLPPLITPADHFLTRRAVTCAAILSVASSPSAIASPPPRVEGFAPRVEGAGNAADLISFSVAVPDVTYPPSLIGLWQCERMVRAVEGDVAQAQGAWFDLGGSAGGDDFRRVAERYYTRFVPPPSGGGLVLDRAYEIESRVRGASAKWSASERSSTTTYERTPGGAPTELVVVRRRVEDLKPPSGGELRPGDEVGFGFDELVRVTTAAGGLFGGAQVVKAARVQRRFRRAFGDDGARTLEGLEIMRTYHVLDGIAGVEMPTSTTKSTLRLTRPTVEQLKADQVRPFEVPG